MSKEQIKQTCQIIKDAPIKYFYIADTYGNLGIYKNDFEITEKNYPINFRLKHYPIYKSLNTLEFYHYLKYILFDYHFILWNNEYKKIKM